MIRMTLAITLTQSSTANVYMGTVAWTPTIESEDWLCAEKVFSMTKTFKKPNISIYLYILQTW